MLLALALLLTRPASAATVWLTRADQSALLAPSQVAESDCAADTSAVVVAIDSAALGQPVVGFGAAMTESSALVLDSLPRRERARALSDLFGPEGLRLSVLRVPIGASDFSRDDYSCDDPPSGADPSLKSFSLKRCEGTALPYLRKARALNPDLKLMGTPWSAPAWMKSNGSMNNGSLKPEFYGLYARYLVRFADEMKRAGLPLTYLTPINEPGNGDSSYPTMVMTSTEEARLIGKFLGPTLQANGFSDLKVLVYDHNWSSAAYAAAVLSDPDARRYAAGSAFHCYEGSPDMMAPVFTAFPDKEIHFTECSAGGWEPRFGPSLGFAVRDLVIGDLANGARSVMLWNLALDERGGPTNPNHGCLNCRGVITVVRSSATYERTPEYYALAHASLAAPPGTRVAASRVSGPAEGFHEVSLRRPDGEVSVVALNESAQPRPARFQAAGRCLAYDLPAGSVLTLRWKPGP